MGKLATDFAPFGLALLTTFTNFMTGVAVAIGGLGRVISEPEQDLHTLESARDGGKQWPMRSIPSSTLSEGGAGSERSGKDLGTISAPLNALKSLWDAVWGSLGGAVSSALGAIEGPISAIAGLISSVEGALHAPRRRAPQARTRLAGPLGRPMDRPEGLPPARPVDLSAPVRPTSSVRTAPNSSAQMTRATSPHTASRFPLCQGAEEAGGATPTTAT